MNDKEKKTVVEETEEETSTEEEVPEEDGAEEALDEVSKSALEKLKSTFREQNGEDLFDTDSEEQSFMLGYQQGFIDGQSSMNKVMDGLQSVMAQQVQQQNQNEE